MDAVVIRNTSASWCKFVYAIVQFSGAVATVYVQLLVQFELVSYLIFRLSEQRFSLVAVA